MRVYIPDSFLNDLEKGPSHAVKALRRLVRTGAVTLWSSRKIKINNLPVQKSWPEMKDGFFHLNLKKRKIKGGVVEHIIQTFDNQSVPLFTISRENDLLLEEVNAAVKRVITSGRFVLGSEVEKLEKELSAYLNVKYAVTVNSGTDALELALRALIDHAPAGVITTPFTFHATVEAIFNAEHIPFFVDITETGFLMDATAVENFLKRECRKGRDGWIHSSGIPLRALLPVHLYGEPCNMEELEEIARSAKLVIIEDAAQAFGAVLTRKNQSFFAGTVSDAGAFSFYPSKPLGALGDGGAVVTSSQKVAEAVKKLRDHCRSGATHEGIGRNSRLDELQAAILRVKLKHVEKFQKRREQVAAYYMKHQRLFNDNLHLPHPRNHVKRHAWHLFTIRACGSTGREWVSLLRKHNVESRIYYPHLITDLPFIFTCSPQKHTEFPNAKQRTQEVFSVPMGGALSQKEINRVVQALTSSKHTKRK